MAVVLVTGAAGPLGSALVRGPGAAESARAHFIYPSIVGVDRIGGTYYRAKWQAEQIVESARHWTIQRATQLHPCWTGC